MTAALGTAPLVVPAAPGFEAAAATNPGMTPPPAPPPAKGSSDKGDKPKTGEDHHNNPDPNWDVLEGLGGLNVGGRSRRPNRDVPVEAIGAGAPGDEAAANDAVASAAQGRRSSNPNKPTAENCIGNECDSVTASPDQPKSGIDMDPQMRAERGANNRARIAELEARLATGGGQAEFWSGAQLAQARADRAVVIALIEAAERRYLAHLNAKLDQSGAALRSGAALEEYQQGEVQAQQQLAPILSRYAIIRHFFGIGIGRAQQTDCPRQHRIRPI